MSRIATEPPAPVRSLAELLRIAHAMETDACQRYTEAARLLRLRGYPSLADVFVSLSEVEAGHVQQVENWEQTAEPKLAHGQAPPWPIPDTFDMTPEEAGNSSMLTPYRILSSAVRHEERAFVFWSYVAAHGDRRDVREAAEKMAHEELGHVALLRRERRKAYHQERKEGRSFAVTVAQVIALDNRLYELLGSDRASLFDKGRMQAIETLRSAELTIAQIGEHSKIENKAAALAEFLLDAYLRIAENASEERFVRAAQARAESLVPQLVELRRPVP